MNESITFIPRPGNIFRKHIDEYFERAKAENECLEGICGKWTYEDLIPGLSDFDTRFIVSDTTAAEDWQDIARAVYRIHTDICHEDPGRARILEHLPGINLTWNETLEAASYYPEFKQWTMYRAPEEKKEQFDAYLASRPWNDVEELFNLNKFALYFTPYNRSIDPPINLGKFVGKYPLHSRILHYFCPPLQSAVSIKLKRMVKGKLESFRLAKILFPNGEVIDECLDIVGSHYETPEYYADPKMLEFETKLFDYLKEALRIIQSDITLLNVSQDDTSLDLKEKLNRVKIGLWNRFFDGAKFSRLMMGRLYFYAENIPHFDSTWLIENELNRIRRLFFENTFSALGMIMWDIEITPEEALERCNGELITVGDYKAVKAYADVFGKSYDSTTIKDYAVEIAGAIGPFQAVLEKLAPLVRQKAVDN